MIPIMRVAIISIVTWIGLYPYSPSAQTPLISKTFVYEGGKDGYHTYRIPALVVTAEGTLLAFCEGRKSSASDEGDIDLLVKRSEDGGKTWSEQMTVHEEGGDAPITIGNPCPIVDENGTIHLPFTHNNKRLFYTKSTDDGLTWSEPMEHTGILDGFDYPLVRIATGPGHGIQMSTGRLIAPVWVSDRERRDVNKNVTNRRYQSGIIYSDDAGVTWHTGGLVPPTIRRLNEAMVIERRDGSLFLNMRAYGSGYRATSVSKDAGVTWCEPVLETDLPCPTCQASMIKLTDREVLFANPAVTVDGKVSGANRRNLTVRLSTDEGRTWKYSHELDPGRAGYSDLAVAKDGTIFCLYECGEERYNQRLTIARFNRAWILGTR